MHFQRSNAPHTARPQVLGDLDIVVSGRAEYCSLSAGPSPGITFN